MNVGSLFSGIGGIELGFHAEGFNTVWFVEQDLYAQAILRKHFPNSTIYDDVTTLDFNTVPKVDVLTGGFPCQDISNAGKRAGITGSRSSLWKYYCEAIRTLRPKYALIENVSALVNRGLEVVLADLAQIGYDAEWHCVSASAVGALHRRDRIFILAYSNDADTRHEWTGCEQLKEGISQTTGVMENTKCNGIDEGCRQDVDREETRKEHTDKPFCTSENVPNSCKERLQRCEQKERYASRQGWWATEPKLGRVAHGVSNRVDRIKCLGNAVVPQVAQVFAQAIKEVERGDAP